MNKGNGQDNTGTKVLAALNKVASARAIAHDHGEDASETGNDDKDGKGNDMMPDNILAFGSVVMIITDAVKQTRRQNLD